MKLFSRSLCCLIIFEALMLAVPASADETEGISSGLTVAKIMRDPKWMGSSPKGIFWSENSKSIYFKWNPENADGDSLYVVSRGGGKPRRVTLDERKALPAENGDYNKSYTKKTYAKGGDIFILDIKRGKKTQVTNTLDKASSPVFNLKENKIIYELDNNLFSWNISSGETVQITDFKTGSDKSEDEESKGAQEKWLKEQQLGFISVLKERKEKKERDKESKEEEQPKRPLEIYLDGKNIEAITPSPDERYVTFRLEKETKDDKRTIAPSYVTESGFTEDLNARTKVGRKGSTYELGIYDRERDTVYYVSTDSIPEIYDQPEYLKELEGAANDGNESLNAEALEEKPDEEEKPREVVIRGPWWSENGKSAFVVVMSLDFKDHWIMTLDAESGALSLLDWQHDDAWIGGPGIWGWTYQGEVGWTPDNKSVWFMSEETGYSQLYTVNASSKKKIRLTHGDFEIQDVKISRDKKLWYYVSNEVHPGEQHFYQMPIKGGTPTRLTFADGKHEVFISPDEKTLAIRYSFSNKPWELLVQDNKFGSSPKQITNSLSEEFNSYSWRSPKVLTFTARDGVEVYARLYRPKNPQAKGPAVIFVHGAGYTQNAHRWWSKYYREYMFNNLLVDNGYTVLDIDYRASRGYGRECRTAIYRFMGGKDLTDNVDGARFLVDNYDIDSTRIGIYGGSYGGFITLMAMFTTPDVFSAGAALRPVTDWAHYNHGYTANILNTPATDSLAFARSSPIYHAEGLKGALLMCHGMIDTNVHFQDVVRLAQRLIELGKENWEVAVYPLEAHSFKEPSSWTDEYRRIFKLFEDNLK